MSNSPEEIIATICPELSGSPSLQVYLGMAAEVTSRGFFGAVYNQALALRAAHLFTLFDQSSTASDIQKLGGGAAITSMSEGGLSVSFAQAAGDNSDLGSTKYGKLLAALMKGRVKMGINQSGGIEI